MPVHRVPGAVCAADCVGPGPDSVDDAQDFRVGFAGDDTYYSPGKAAQVSSVPVPVHSGSDASSAHCECCVGGGCAAHACTAHASARRICSFLILTVPLLVCRTPRWQPRWQSWPKPRAAQRLSWPSHGCTTGAMTWFQYQARFPASWTGVLAIWQTLVQVTPGQTHHSAEPAFVWHPGSCAALS